MVLLVPALILYNLACMRLAFFFTHDGIYMVCATCVIHELPGHHCSARA